MFDRASSAFSALKGPEPFDACVIGSGFAGIVVAKGLVERGARTLLLESGQGMLNWLLDKRLHELAAYEFSGDTDYPLKRTKARIVGGNSNFWTGRAERFHPSDFADHPYLPSPWPIGYDELEPYYVRAERTLRVRAADFSEFAAPRSENPAVPPRPNISDLRAILARAGVTLDYSATATPRRAFRFFRMNHEVLPEVRRNPRLTLVSNATVTRLLVEPDGLVGGAEVRALDRTTKVARAKVFVVCCGGFESPRLLLLSRSESFPNGIGNRFDRVGRGFNEHASVNFYGAMTHRRGTVLPRHKIGRSHQFYERYRNEGLGALLLNAIQSWVFPNHLLKFRLVDMPRYAAFLAKRVIRPELYLGTTIEMTVEDSNRITLSDRMTDHFGNPLAHMIFNYSTQDRLLMERSRELVREIYSKLGISEIREGPDNFSMHHQGTCRMGDDPKVSVVDRDLRVHESPNLYVCGAENLVSGSAVPPTLTLVALAHRLADHLGEALHRLPSRSYAARESGRP
ncbi:MAG TPA: GMC family oxidoreductase [Candidatus Polarisedimenticolaceae bacterium]|nr:GMC family oxidoreductase [Candidatus Polarisedimenticolaceae bacterium]